MNPARLGPYTLRGRLGRGGMGTVYEAVDATGAVVAVKTLTAHLGDDAPLRRRFEAEIEALRALRHPGIVRLLAFGEEDGRPFFAMELVRGRSLEDLLRDGCRFDWRRTVTVASEISRALKSAHDQGIVHRDLKPANLLFPDDPAAGATVKLADFGIARLFGDAALTQAGTVVGTAEYMAPEQAAGDPVDARVDLYALGLVMYAMLTGNPPFRGGSMSEVLRRQRRETPPRLSALVPEIPASLEDLVARLLAKRPDERPASALAVGRTLVTIEAGEPGASGSPAARPTSRDSSPTVANRPAAGGNGPDLLAATKVTGDTVAIEATTPPAAIDGEAVTRAFAAATSGAGDSLAHRVTAPDHGAVPGEVAGPGSRFTTVEELHRASQAAADRTARRDALLRIAVAGGLLAAVLAGGYAALRPATADQLHERIVAIAADPAGDRRDARPLIDVFLARCADDPRAPAVRRLRREIDLDGLERRARRRPRDAAVLAPVERDYRAAMDRETESPLACLTALEAILALHGEQQAQAATAAIGKPAKAGEEATEAADALLWLDLVRRQIDRLGPLAAREREQDSSRAAATLAEAAALAQEAGTVGADSRGALLGRRRTLLQGLVEIYGDRAHVADAVAEARRQLDDAAGTRPIPDDLP